ncbi:carboxylating nicotinate-nucleotide diphosphorylase [Marine Group I thaumarchaeote]|uniref:Nicotinate-nucleotide pyrophosphorylase [carboxylating] n=1 Tax=Marine Group I thaumarchaeote TaxID=2511932 RepID=A0A7K4NUP7_9ARCH|nr:carboxylating nicotinate-nucleotide diphosphorylase [Marine Group I thaumarchaeote]
MGTNIKKELLRFISEDVQSGDITSVLLPKKKIKAKIISRQEGILAGIRFAKDIFYLKGCRVRIIKKDGVKLKPNQIILQVSGDAKAVLSCERTVLNLLARMSGIATQTSLLVSKIRKINRKTKLYSTRKTAPGLRFFDKEAVVIGGGHKHRMSLNDMVMIKDNHLLVSNSIENITKNARRQHKDVEVEVENQRDAMIAASSGATIVMLDNFSPAQIKKTISALQKKKLRNKVKLEASGGINSKNIAAYAKTGVDMISVGSITNSVKSLDLSLEVCV